MKEFFHQCPFCFSSIEKLFPWRLLVTFSLLVFGWGDWQVQLMLTKDMEVKDLLCAKKLLKPKRVRILSQSTIWQTPVCQQADLVKANETEKAFRKGYTHVHVPPHSLTHYYLGYSINNSGHQVVQMKLLTKVFADYLPHRSIVRLRYYVIKLL